MEEEREERQKNLKKRIGWANERTVELEQGKEKKKKEGKKKGKKNEKKDERN